MKGVFKNWKTSLAGIIAIATALGPLLTALTKGDYYGALGMFPSVAAGIGLILAQDFGVKL